MTRRGKLFTAIYGVVVALAVGLSIESLYDLGLLMVLLTVGSAVLVHINGRSVYMMFFSKTRRLSRGEEAVVEYMLTNRSLFPIFSMTVKIEFKKELGVSEDSFDEAEFFFSPYRMVTFKRSTVCRRRGFYKVGNMSVIIRDPMGFFEKTLHFEKAVDIAVLPRVIPVAGFNHEPRDREGRRKARNLYLQDRTLIRSIRPYQPLDLVQDIHWKLSARLGELQVKTFQVNTRETLVILINGDRKDYAFFGEQVDALDEKAVELAVSACKVYLEKGWEVKVLLHGKNRSTLTLSGPNQLGLLLEEAAAFELDNTLYFDKILDCEMGKWAAGTRMLLITPDAEGRYERWVREIGEKGMGLELWDPSLIKTEDVSASHENVGAM